MLQTKEARRGVLFLIPVDCRNRRIWFCLSRTNESPEGDRITLAKTGAQFTFIVTQTGSPPVRERHVWMATQAHQGDNAHGRSIFFRKMRAAYPANP